MHVAPRAGAWIETENKNGKKIENSKVAPRAGAWIETLCLNREKFGERSHPVRVRGLKLVKLARGSLSTVSHPVRVRGLKRPIF